jgi:hypothetical protein
MDRIQANIFEKISLFKECVKLVKEVFTFADYPKYGRKKLFFP